MTSPPRIIQIVYLLVALLLLPGYSEADSPQSMTKGPETTETAPVPCRPCEEFDRLNSLVRDGKVSRTEAGRKIGDLLPLLKDYYYRNGGRNIGSSEWVFPLRSYGARALGGGRSHGYEPRGYNWFDGNRHKGHPSFDIFIRDRNRDDRDDRTGSFVQVLSLTGGIVVARETGWEPGSGLRGGKYLWIYDPASDALVYYAHNRDLLVGIGVLVKPGDPIALVGRTGLNAYRKRSPTHLHLTYLELKNDSFAPRYIYPQLLKCRTRE
jgi:murein DD-endopeptidase MepM/ murein hydrolase activator NlpD